MVVHTANLSVGSPQTADRVRSSPAPRLTAKPSHDRFAAHCEPKEYVFSITLEQVDWTAVLAGENHVGIAIL